MKKFLTIVFLCFLGTGVYAQGISGGLKVGLNMANQKFSGNGFTTSPSFLPGIHGGVYLTCMFSEHIGLQPELLYSGQGFKSGDNKFKVDYVAIPILVRFNVNNLLSFHAGPQVGLLTSAKIVNDGDKVDVKDELKGTDFGLAFGGTVDLPIKLNFTVRFIMGLSDINDVDDEDITQKNYNIQFSVGYRLFGKD